MILSAARSLRFSRLFDLCAESLFMLLVWDTSPDKPSTFGGIDKVLGLELDLRESQLGRFHMRNTASRCDELRDTISAILERGTLARKECERLRGRLQFASNQVAGKKADFLKDHRGPRVQTSCIYGMCTLMLPVTMIGLASAVFSSPTQAHELATSAGGLQPRYDS